MKVLVFGDVHGNASALQAVLAAEGDADASIFLGDAVLSGPQGNVVLELLRELPPGPAIMGNHDLDLLDPARYAQYPESWVALNNHVVAGIHKEHLPWVEALAPPGKYSVGEMEVWLHHGMVEGGPRHVLPDSPDEHVKALAQGSSCPLVFFGHSHVQFERWVGGQRFINPGSVGQNRCGHKVACYGVIEDGSYTPRSVPFASLAWCDAVNAIAALDPHPEFRAWLIDGLITGFGVGQNEPWLGYAAGGYR